MGCVILTRKLFNLPIFFFIFCFCLFVFFMLKSGAAKAAPAVAVPTPLVWATGINKIRALKNFSGPDLVSYIHQVLK